MDRVKAGPRILLAGTNSGCGKTTVTCGILQYLANQGKKAESFKCGPDYIDPMFHRKIIGVKAGNLDLYTAKENMVKYLLDRGRNQRDIAVIEGVMGFYDGINYDNNPGYASSHHLSMVTDTPVVLVVNGRGMAQSILAMIKGYLSFAPNLIKGVILNQVSQRTFYQLKDEIEQGLNIAALGYVPKDDAFRLESRHLGLVTADEVENLKATLDNLVNTLEETIDFDMLLTIAKAVEPLSYDIPHISPVGENIPVGVAMDQAFCFYYKENLKLLEEMGATLHYFSPLKQDHLPENLAGLLLGGGYPELYLEQLSGNTRMRNEIYTALNQGIPCIAECGGFMYLMERLESYNMVGFIKGQAKMTDKLVRFGYVALTARDDNLLCEKGEQLWGHEFHYSDSTNNGMAFMAEKRQGQALYPCVHGSHHLYAGYPHLNFWGNISIAENFLIACKQYRSGTTLGV